MDKQAVLSSMSFGQRVAEDEGDELATYFVETDNWRRLFSGEVDIVYGMKGSGKSALYTLLIARASELRARSIILMPAENPRGSPAFRDLVTDPPTSELEFAALWKLYLACLLSDVLDREGIRSSHATTLRSSLEAEGLVRKGRTLKNILRGVRDYSRKAFRPQAVEAGLEIDEASGLPKGFKGRITFREPSEDALAQGFSSVDSLIGLANDALQSATLSVWILLDRLDVAFSESQPLEVNALRALFRVYLDIIGHKAIRLKIFLRSDIWSRLAADGFREASHITRSMTIGWDDNSLMKLIVSRAIQNKSVQDYFACTPQDVLTSTETQGTFFYRMFPDQVDIGPKRPKTFYWMLGRTADGTRKTAPRELVHLLNSLREVQIAKLEVGEIGPGEEQLFARSTFRQALVDVSKTRLTQTLYAEYPRLQERIGALQGEKTVQSSTTLAAMWEVSPDEAAAIASELVEVGFFEKRGTRESPEYWVPFLYRDALELVQGTAEE